MYLHLHVERNSQNLKFLDLKVNSDGGLVVPLEDIPTIPAGGGGGEGKMRWAMVNREKEVGLQGVC